MHVQYLKYGALSELRHSISTNIKKYEEEKSWLDSFFNHRDYLAESRLEIESWPDLALPDGKGELYELENTIRLHEALKQLTPSQASDERLWTWLAHGPYWTYMRRRWPVEGQSRPPTYILEHYFVADARSLVRHGLARLWWFGHATAMVDEAHVYDLTAALLKTTDARQSLMERTYWRNHRILAAILRRVRYWESHGLDFYVPRERFRRLCKSINLFGGTLLLDAVDENVVNMLVDGVAQSEINA